MNPPTATRATRSKAVSIAARLSPGEPDSAVADRDRVAKIVAAKVASVPGLRGFRRGRSVVAESDRAPPRSDLAAAEPGEGQTMAMGWPRSALSRSSVRLTMTATA